MCGDHSNNWIGDTGTHVPRLDHLSKTAACSCGTPLAGPTLGDMKRAYHQHLDQHVSATHN
jgi:hypothetical protein